MCDAACMQGIDSLPETVTASGLKFRDIRVGRGPTPPTGYQVRKIIKRVLQANLINGVVRQTGKGCGV